MQIHGLQKMTLLDFPEHVACTVFLGGCDLRCPFCHNYELADGSAPPVMDDEALLSFLSKRRGLLDGVAITGGEPCLRQDLPVLVSRIRDLGFAVKLDTNGFHPGMLGKLLGDGAVDYVAMDIKNSPAKYALTAGVPEPLDLAPLYESIGMLISSGTDHEFRTTVVQELHEAEDFRQIGEMIRGAGKYFLQSFTDRDTVPFQGFSAPSKENLNNYADIVREYVCHVTIRGTD